MISAVLNVSTQVNCSHGGRATAVTPFERVRVDGQPILTTQTGFQISGCPLAPGEGGPCVTGRFLSGATRVSAGGLPLALQHDPSVCDPTGSPMIVVLVAQSRVTAM